MSLYYDAVKFLERPAGSEESLASVVYRAKDIKTKPVQVYALVSEATKWSSVLSEIINKIDLLKTERKLNPSLALLLCHDLLLSKGGVAASKDHVLKLAITRHKARLSAEFTRARVRAGFGSVAEWKIHLEISALPGASHSSLSSQISKHPRWVRINTIRTSLLEQLNHGVFKDWSTTDSIVNLTNPGIATPPSRLRLIDQHVPDLIATPAGTDLSKTDASRSGALIFQEKASCFPAYLLDPKPSDGDFIDACAAPGNKTTHLAALLRLAQLSSGASGGSAQQIYACERDATRSLTLQKMVRIAGASGASDSVVQVLSGQDFLKLDPQDKRFRNVGALLLDPSCSGSGIVGRDDGDDEDVLPPLVLPKAYDVTQFTPDKSKKRKRGATQSDTERKDNARQTETNGSRGTNGAAPSVEQDQEKLAARLAALSGFQLTLLKRAFTFPSARKIVYSTCSTHAAENEDVTVRALASGIARSRGWRVLRREEQVDGMKRWGVRGDVEAVRRLVQQGAAENLDIAAEEIAAACLRCEKGTIEGTMGFFAVGFMREDSRAARGVRHAPQEQEQTHRPIGDDEAQLGEACEEEWQGFDSGGE